MTDRTKFYSGSNLIHTSASRQNKFRDVESDGLQPAITIKPYGFFDDLLTFAKSPVEPAGQSGEAVDAGSEGSADAQYNSGRHQLEEWVNRLRTTSDKVSFERFRLLDVDWEGALPESVGQEELELRYTKSYFEKIWGAKPFSELSVANSLSNASMENLKPASPLLVSNFRFWASDIEKDESLLVAIRRTYQLVALEGQTYLLLSAKPLDFISQYEKSWEQVDAVLRVEAVPVTSYRAPIDFSGISEEALQRMLRERRYPLIGPRINPLENLNQNLTQDLTQNLDQNKNLGAPGVTFVTSISASASYEALLQAILASDAIKDDLVDIAEFRTKAEEFWQNSRRAFDTQDVLSRYSEIKAQADNNLSLWISDGYGDGYSETPLGSPNLGMRAFKRVPRMTEAPDSAWIMSDPISGRKYLLELSEDGAPLASTDDWDAIWENNVVGVQLLSQSEVGRQPTQEELSQSDSNIFGRNEAKLILEQFASLDSELSVLKKLLEKFEAWIDESANSGIDSAALVRQHAAQIMDLRRRETEISQLLNSLVSRARQLGYHLFLDAPSNDETFQPFKHHAKAPSEIKALEIVTPKRGQLYLREIKQVTWTEQYTRKKKKKKRNGRTWDGRRKYKWVTVDVPYTQKKQDAYINYAPIDPGHEPWEGQRDLLISEGYHVHVLSQVDGDYVSDSGERLADVMERCRFDEEYRRTCALFIPEYDRSLHSGLVVAKYHVISKPMPGFVPSGTPTFRVRENLSFRKTLVGTELGELVNSITLAPGERRRIAYKRSYERKLDTRRETKSYLDITEGRDSSFGQSLEDELRATSKDTSGSASSMGIQASGSHKGASSTFSASDDTNDTSSLEEFSREFQSTAQKAAENYKKTIREEAQTVHSEFFASENEETIESEVENINQGLSLNILYHKLTNTYLSAVFLDDFSFQITDPVELVQGTGITNKIYITRARAETLRDFIEDYASPYVDAGVSPEDVSDRILDRIEAFLLSDYLSTYRNVFSGSTFKDGFFDGSRTLPEEIWDLQIESAPLNTFLIKTPSDAVYADSILGVNPATEPYSEAMRALGIQRERAEVSLIEAQARSLETLASFSVVEDVKFTSKFTDGSWVIRLNADLPTGDWCLAVGSRPIVSLESGKNRFVLPGPIMSEEESLSMRLLDYSRLLEILPNRIQQLISDDD